jgi:protein TonB
MSMATWRGQVMAHLNRRKRHPGGAAGGTASVSFTIDRSGRVLSARLIRSSGSAILDREAVALARRASPVPAPPAGIGRSTVNLSVPVRFAR